MSGLNNNIFQFCGNRKAIQNFRGINFKHFNIYKNKKYILTKKKISIQAFSTHFSRKEE